MGTGDENGVCSNIEILDNFMIFYRPIRFFFTGDGWTDDYASLCFMIF